MVTHWELIRSPYLLPLFTLAPIFWYGPKEATDVISLVSDDARSEGAVNKSLQGISKRSTRGRGRKSAASERLEGISKRSEYDAKPQAPARDARARASADGHALPCAAAERAGCAEQEKKEVRAGKTQGGKHGERVGEEK
eukprot:653017-Pleurochrysis_carterae.AAC.1